MNPPHPALSPSEGERVPEGRVRGRFMVPMHAKKRKRLPMNLGGARLRRALIFCRWERSGLDGVSPHRSWFQCATEKS